MSYVLHQVGAKQKLISKVYRVLKNEGHIAILTSSHDQLKNEPLHQYFPGILEANLNRFPDIADVEGMLVEAGFKNVHSSTISIPRDMSTDQMIALARGKNISVLKLLSEDKFQNGLSIFEKRLKSKYNDTVRYQDSSSLIIANKLG